MSEHSQPRGSASNHFHAFGHRVFKFAESKIRDGINYLETHNQAGQTPPLHPQLPNPVPVPPPLIQSQEQQTGATVTIVNPQQYYVSQHPSHLPQSGFQASQFSSYYHTPAATAPLNPVHVQSINPPYTSSGNPSQAPPVNPSYTAPVSAPQSTPVRPPPHPSMYSSPQNPPAPLLNWTGPIVTPDLLSQMSSRYSSACNSLGTANVTQARRGLSRILTPSHEDIELFGTQLKNSDVRAIERNWSTCDNLPIFPVSYVQHPSPAGRFMFSDQQWQNLHEIVKGLAHSGVAHFRLWLDQCHWLRDFSEHSDAVSWVHFGILPFVIWPAISLGVKKPGVKRTTDSFQRMWQFVEQIAALWGMGLIIGSEYRSGDTQADTKTWLSYNIRSRKEPKTALMILLLNLFHGATDSLETGWNDDSAELMNIAEANIMRQTDDIIIGSNWKDRAASLPLRDYPSVLERLQLPIHGKVLGGLTTYLDRDNIFLEGSRKLQSRGWHGFKEWFSGNEGYLRPTNTDLRNVYQHMNKYQVITDNGEYHLLQSGGSTQVIWLLVALQEQLAYASRRRVAWTKVLTGLSSYKLGGILEKIHLPHLQKVLRDLLDNNSLRVLSASLAPSEFDWE